MDPKKKNSKDSSAQSKAIGAAVDPRIFAFIEKQRSIGKIRLPAFAVGHLACLQATQSRFLEIRGEFDKAFRDAQKWADLPGQVNGFLFIVGNSPRGVAKAIHGGNDYFQRAATKFAMRHSAASLQSALKVVLEILFEFASEDGKEIKGSPPSSDKIDFSAPNWLAAHVQAIASHSGWDYDFIVWKLPLSVGLQLRHASLFISPLNSIGREPIQGQLNTNDELFQQLDAALKGAPNG